MFQGRPLAHHKNVLNPWFGIFGSYSQVVHICGLRGWVSGLQSNRNNMDISQYYDKHYIGTTKTQNATTNNT